MTPNAASTNRTETPLAYCPQHSGGSDNCCHTGWAPDGTKAEPRNGALISGQYKLLWGTQFHFGTRTGPDFPNGTSVKMDDPGCPQGCLFNIFADPEERDDLREAEPAVFQQLYNRLLEVGLGVYQTDYTDVDQKTCLTGAQMRIKYGGYLGPSCGVAPPVTPAPAPPAPAFAILHSGRCLIPPLACAATNGDQCPPPVLSDSCGAEAMRWTTGTGGTSGYVAVTAQGKGPQRYLKLNETSGPPPGSCTPGYVFLNHNMGSGGPQHQGFVLSNGSLRSTACAGRCITASSSTDIALSACGSAGTTGWSSAA